jgi:four helix bundle protein
MIKSVEDLKVYREAFRLAMFVFDLCKSFPASEKYSLTAQFTRSSRSVAANIREGYAKRTYEQVFVRHLIDALGSSEESRCWLDFALACNYITKEIHSQTDSAYQNLSAMIFSLQKNWKKR